MIDELLESPAFWILGGGGVAMEVLGWTFSKKISDYPMPWWFFPSLIVGTLVAAAFFALKE